MKILIGCEKSGTLRRSFAKYGHDATSCDLKPSYDNSPNHIMGDIIKFLENNGTWDLIILHPECTYLALCANRHYAAGTEKHYLRLMAIEWTIKLWKLAKLKGKRVALENPASVIFKHLDGNVQYVQPYQFGDMKQKKTGFELFNLPHLKDTNNVYSEMMKLPKSQREECFYMSPSPERSAKRSNFLPGISDAIAQQWGN